MLKRSALGYIVRTTALLSRLALVLTAPSVQRPLPALPHLNLSWYQTNLSDGDHTPFDIS